MLTPSELFLTPAELQARFLAIRTLPLIDRRIGPSSPNFVQNNRECLDIFLLENILERRLNNSLRDLDFFVHLLFYHNGILPHPCSSTLLRLHRHTPIHILLPPPKSRDRDRQATTSATRKHSPKLPGKDNSRRHRFFTSGLATNGQFSSPTQQTSHQYARRNSGLLRK